ncbi:MAG TPA: glycosyltransferase [Candidatus Polarisedimenticolia bacterium]|nr:glycosyltransferase [Candidatus Polarisedimenticolia bacterium]
MTPLLVHAVVPPERVGLTALRIRQPLAALARLPGIECRIDEAAGFRPDRRVMAKILLMQRRMLSLADANLLLRPLIDAGYVLVMELDDHPVRRAGYAQAGFLGLRAMHALQTTTEPLAELLRQYNPTVGVFANQIETLPALRPREGPATLFFGALNREVDWAPLMSALNRQLSRRPEVRVEVVHDRAFFDALATANKRFTATNPYGAYLDLLAGSDICLMPLSDNAVNRCKSDVKFIEAAATGAAALASPVVYAGTIRDGETGLLFESPEAFEAKLSALLDRPELRQRLAITAHEYVRQKRLLAAHISRQAEWYRLLSVERVQLTAELAARAPDLPLS